MAQKTFTQMVAAVTKNSQRTDDATLIQTKVRDTLTLILNRDNFPKLEDIDTVTTVASQGYTAFPTLFKALYDEKSVTSGVSGELQHLRVLSPSQFIDKHSKPDEDTEAMPRECMFFENKIYWHPIPDDAYAIRLHFFKFHADFSDDDPHTLGEQADLAIERIATAMVYEVFQEYDDATYWYKFGFDELAKYVSILEGQDGLVVVRSPQLYGPTQRVATADSTDYGRIK